MPLPFLRLSRTINVYIKEFHSHILKHLQICIWIIDVELHMIVEVYNEMRKVKNSSTIFEGLKI